MKPGATLGLSHGFLLGAMRNDEKDFRDDINVILVAPKVCSTFLTLSGPRCQAQAAGSMQFIESPFVPQLWSRELLPGRCCKPC